MRVCGIAIALLAVCPWVAAAEPATTTAPATSEPATAVGQPPFAADGMTITAAEAQTWQQGSLSVVELRGPVRIALGPNDAATLTADAAVVLAAAVGRRPPAGGPVDVVVLGHAEVAIGGVVTFSYDRYWVPAVGERRRSAWWGLRSAGADDRVADVPGRCRR